MTWIPASAGMTAGRVAWIGQNSPVTPAKAGVQVLRLRLSFEAEERLLQSHVIQNLDTGLRTCNRG